MFFQSVKRNLFEFAGGDVRLAKYWHRTVAVALIAAVFGLVGPSVLVGFADESAVPSSLTHSVPRKVPFFLTDIPSEAQHLVPALHHIIEISESISAAQGGLKMLRAELDGVLTQLTSLKSELNVVTEQRSRREEEFARLESEAVQRFESLKFDLANKLEQALTQSREQVGDELDRGVATRLDAFESRQREIIQKTLSQELELEDRELDQLGKEIEVQSQELSDRLIKLDDRSELANTLKRTTQQLLAKKRSDLEARRSRLSAERDAVYARQRGEMIEVLKEQQYIELQRRLTVKEASLRSSMAELLHRTRKDSNAKIEEIRATVSSIRKRYGGLAEDFSALTAQQKSVEGRIATQSRAMEGLEGERHAALVRLEEAFRKRDGKLVQKAIVWFGEAMQSAPQDLAVDLGMLHQRLVAMEEQERRLEEQKHLLRERQLALQVSREMETQYQRIQEQQRLKEQAKADKAESLLKTARTHADNGNYDQALKIVAKAQALNPPQIQRIAMAREEFIADQRRVAHMRQSAEIERLFERAMKTFDEGRYEDAVAMFEQVIDQEASMGQTLSQLAENPNP